MSNPIIFDIWAPREARWSPWVKPVLFAHMDAGEGVDDAVPLVLPSADWAPPVQHHAALVLDLPGAEGVALGLALAARGYQPVPLYNACPSPKAGAWPVIVDVAPVMAALVRGSAQLRACALPPDAPPAFLLDARRRGSLPDPDTTAFDNRSVCFPSDFPSANFLLANTVDCVLLVQVATLAPAADLSHALRRWQEQGVKVQALSLAEPAPIQPCVVPRFGWYRSAVHRMAAAFGFHRNILGGFGGVVQAGGGAG